MPAYAPAERKGAAMRALAGLAAGAAVLLAACGGSASAARVPTCSTWTAPDGSVAVLRIHLDGTKFTGTDTRDGLTGHLSGTAKNGKLTGFVRAAGVTLRLNGSYTATTVKLKATGHDVFTTANGCPS